MTMPLSPEKIHDRDWQDKKETDDFHERALRYPDIIETVLKVRPRKILDVGCGSGYLAKLLKTRAPDLTVDGIDISRVALDRAKQHLHEFWQLNIDQKDFPLGPESYDTAVCVEVLEHLYDPEHALKEIYRILQPGGRAVITVPNLAYWRYRLDLMRGRVPLPAADQRHLHQYNLSLFRQTLVQGGFQIEEIRGHAVRLPFLAGWKPDLFSDILIATVRKT
jgi:2-polyprenyl-3-methyl-5-hydroxy-6-metoxy-1,4-benzoquinol methylase